MVGLSSPQKYLVDFEHLPLPGAPPLPSILEFRSPPYRYK